MSENATPRRLAAILHADVVGYSRLMSAEEEATVERLTQYRAAMKQGIDRHSGHVVDTAGDSMLVEFSSVVAAMKCAVELQDMLASRNAELPPEQRLVFRMGLELADIITRDDAVYGDGINVAARLQAMAEPGGICVSDAVRRAVANRLPVEFVSLGEHTVKNISEPVRVFKIVTKTATGSSPSQKTTAPGRGTRYSIVGILVVGAILIALAGLLTVWIMSREETVATAVKTDPKIKKTTKTKVTEKTQTPAKLSADKPSIAVLPFSNVSDDKEQEYFSDGISEDLIISLSRVSNLQVIARSSAFYYKGRNVKTEDVGHELGVRYVLTGSVRKAGARIRITTELVDTTNSHQLWATKYDRKLEDIFDLQDEITGKIVTALVVQLSAREKQDLALRSTNNVAAYQAFLKGQQLDREGTREELASAQVYYREAMKLDPQFGRAYGSLAVTIARSIAWAIAERSSELLDQALELAQQATSLNENLPQTHWALGYVYLQRHEPEPALIAAQRAVEIAPNYADGYGLLALINNHLGRGEEAIRLITRGMALNPRYSWDYSYNLGRGYYNIAQYDKAVDLFLDALARNNYIPVPRGFLISCYIRLGRVEDARWEAIQLQTNNPDFTLSRVRSQASFSSKEKLEAYIADLAQAGVPK